jgi:hypothetical protein
VLNVLSPSLGPSGVRRRLVNALLAPIFLEALHLLRQVLKIRHRPHQDLKFEFLFSCFRLSFTLLRFVVFILITGLCSFIDAFIFRRHKLSQCGQGIVNFGAPGFFNEGVINLPLSFTCSA